MTFDWTQADKMTKPMPAAYPIALQDWYAGSPLGYESTDAEFMTEDDGGFGFLQDQTIDDELAFGGWGSGATAFRDDPAFCLWRQSPSRPHAVKMTATFRTAAGDSDDQFCLVARARPVAFRTFGQEDDEGDGNGVFSFWSGIEEAYALRVYTNSIEIVRYNTNKTITQLATASTTIAYGTTTEWTFGVRTISGGVSFEVTKNGVAIGTLNGLTDTSNAITNIGGMNGLGLTRTTRTLYSTCLSWQLEEVIDPLVPRLLLLDDFSRPAIAPSWIPPSTSTLLPWEDTLSRTCHNLWEWGGSKAIVDGGRYGVYLSDAGMTLGETAADSAQASDENFALVNLWLKGAPDPDQQATALFKVDVRGQGTFTDFDGSVGVFCRASRSAADTNPPSTSTLTGYGFVRSIKERKYFLLKYVAGVRTVLAYVGELRRGFFDKEEFALSLTAKTSGANCLLTARMIYGGTTDTIFEDNVDSDSPILSTGTFGLYFYHGDFVSVTEPYSAPFITCTTFQGDTGDEFDGFGEPELAEDVLPHPPEFSDDTNANYSVIQTQSERGYFQSRPEFRIPRKTLSASWLLDTVDGEEVWDYLQERLEDRKAFLLAVGETTYFVLANETVSVERGFAVWRIGSVDLIEVKTDA